MLKVQYDCKGRVESIVMALPGDVANTSAECTASELGLLYGEVAMLAVHHNNMLAAELEAWEEVAHLEEYARNFERLAHNWEDKYHIAMLETAVRYDNNGNPRIEWTTNDETSPNLGMRDATAVKVPKGIGAYTTRDIATWLYNDGWRWQEGKFYDTPVPPSAEDDCPF